MGISVEHAEVCCTLTDKDFNIRRENIKQQIMPYLLRSELVGACLILTFPQRDSIRVEVEQFVDVEKQCCHHLNFRFDTVDEGTFKLIIEGPPGHEPTLAMLSSSDQPMNRHHKNMTFQRMGLVGIVLGSIACLACAIPFILAFLGLSGVGVAMMAWPLQLLEIIGVFILMLGIGVYMFNRMRKHSQANMCDKSCK